MNFMQYFQFEALLAMIFSFVGCSIRYGELYKQHQSSWSFYIIDALIAMSLGYITYLELTIEFELSLVHTYLVCIIIGNMGSKVLTLVKMFIFSKINKIHNIDLSQVQIEENKDDTNTNSHEQLPKK